MDTVVSHKNDFRATRWYKNGDHPDDNSQILRDSNNELFLSEGHMVRYFRHPNIDGQSKCVDCGAIHHVHGWIDLGSHGIKVCPGNWIVTYGQGEVKVMTAVEFKEFINQY
jgi:hypothetical protein